MKELTFEQAIYMEQLDEKYGMKTAMSFLEDLGFDLSIWNAFIKQTDKMDEVCCNWLYNSGRAIQDIQFVALGIDEVIEQARTYYECLEY